MFWQKREKTPFFPPPDGEQIRIIQNRFLKRGNGCSCRTDNQNALAQPFHIPENKLRIHLFFPSGAPRTRKASQPNSKYLTQQEKSSCTMEYATVLFLLFRAAGLRRLMIPFGLQSGYAMGYFSFFLFLYPAPGKMSRCVGHWPEMNCNSAV